MTVQWAASPQLLLFRWVGGRCAELQEEFLWTRSYPQRKYPVPCDGLSCSSNRAGDLYTVHAFPRRPPYAPHRNNGLFLVLSLTEYLCQRRFEVVWLMTVYWASSHQPFPLHWVGGRCAEQREEWYGEPWAEMRSSLYSPGMIAPACEQLKGAAVVALGSSPSVAMKCLSPPGMVAPVCGRRSQLRVARRNLSNARMSHLS